MYCHQPPTEVQHTLVMPNAQPQEQQTLPIPNAQTTNQILHKNIFQ